MSLSTESVSVNATGKSLNLMNNEDQTSKITKLAEEVTSNSRQNVDEALDKELEDKLEDLNNRTSFCEESKRKSATLTSTTNSSTEKDKHTSNGVPQGKGSIFKGATPSHHTFSQSFTRNNFRRSFTLPRSLLARKSGQTGPVSENQNGSFMKNIFLTLVRTKSVRKTNKDEKDGPNIGENSNGGLSNSFSLGEETIDN